MDEEAASPGRKRYLVRIAVRDEEALRALMKRGLDITFVQNGQDRGFRVRGILTLEAIGRLADDRFQVLVYAPVHASSPVETSTSEQWTEAVMADLEAQLRER
jgi:hypothetical protein